MTSNRSGDGADKSSHNSSERSGDGADKSSHNSSGGERADAIARLAYEKWQARGCPDQDDLRDWLEAEREILATQAPPSVGAAIAPVAAARR